MKLSINVVTMNRASQLKEALLSCLSCHLPQSTEFIIIDNASTDNTYEIVEEVLGGTNYHYYYERLKENIGCGNGRNYAFSKAKGEYVYMLDDDAYIDLSKGNNFFDEAICILDSNEKIASLTTQIYDLLLKINRVQRHASAIDKDTYSIYMMCGGSHFLRRSFFSGNPYFPNKYGFEEIIPSLMIFDSGYYNAFAPKLLVIHNPLVDKWRITDDIKIRGISSQYAMKKMLYPNCFHPLLYIIYKIRSFKYFNGKESYRLSNEIVQELISAVNYKKLKIINILRLILQFKLHAL